MLLLYIQREKAAQRYIIFLGEVKRKLKLEQNSFSSHFLTVQNCVLNNDYLYTSVLKPTYLKHNLDCLSQVTVYLSSEHKRIFDKYQ